MLPLTLLNAAQDKPMLVELKNSETFNGHLVACDNYMNITLRDVYQTSASGEQFWKMPEVYIKGSTIKYCRVVDTLIDTVREAEEQARKQRQQAASHGHRGRHDGHRGRGHRGPRTRT
ncbi:Similar to S.cerevisiae protein LSM4 (Lsm (Like Sm) protein) [Malassezia sympodialis ATCC 42132]|uniref:LSM complex subunit LSM4 n=1 Tax=Malassezia sympodialis (strain ATCC 42132) TaxID=1230383 RepID=A0A1M8ABR4_MALS4|nr:Similar to S.cerevisiae protein LSM4 (Lsm (Like Sm) protein) [Malassezia sympodialis ATCC 42132]